MHTTTTTTHHPHAHPGTPPPHQQHPRHPVELSRRQVRQLRRRAFRRVLAGAAALALAATGALAAAPGTAAADAHRDGQWYLNDFNIDKVHELSQGEGVTIGVIDEGIDPQHPDLKDNIEKNIAFGEDGPTKKKPSVGEGHATAVASVLAGHGHGTNNQDGILGIAPKADIISVDIFAEAKEPNPSIIADAIMWLTKQGTNIIVVPGIAGAPGNSVEAFNTANNAGVAVVASAGNLTGNDADTVTGWPARAKGAIPVSGTNQNHKFWNGSTDLSNAAPQPQLGLSAPATNIPIAMPNDKYDNVDGTSFSAPIVAGTLALIKSAYPKLEYARMVDRLIETVDDKGTEGFDDKYGWGIVNPYKALTEETTYTGLNNEKQISSPDDRLPLKEQGAPVDNHPPGTNPESTVTPGPDDEAATETPTGPPAWVTITIITAGALLTAALITLVITKTRRGKKNPPPPGTGHPGQPGPTPPTGAPGQPPHAFPPPQNQSYAAPPNSPGSSQPPTSRHTPPPHNPPGPSQPGQPDPAPPPPAGDSVWQPPHDPNTNPPPQ